MQEKDFKVLTNDEIQRIKENYPQGTKIKLLKDMLEEKYPVKAGTIGIVDHVDDIGTIHMTWENGRSLGLIPNLDSFEVVSNSKGLEAKDDIEEEIEK